MTEENRTLAASSVDVVGPIVGTEVLGVVHATEGMADTIPATEETVPLKQESKLLAESIEQDGSSVKEPISSTETNSKVEEQMVIASVDTSPPAEEIVRPAAETSSLAEETVLLTVVMNSPGEEIIPSLEDPSSPSGKAAQTNSPKEQIVPSADRPNLPTETVSAAAEADLEANITTTEEIDQPGDERVPFPGATILTAEGTTSPAEIVQSENAEGEITTTHPEKDELQDKKIVQDNKALEHSTGEDINKAGKPSENDVPLPEEDCQVNGDGNVAENQEVGDDMEVADEDVYSEEFQHENGSSEYASVSPTLSCQRESADTVDCTGERSQAGRKPDITKHNYSKYNTVSYRKIKKGNTKQRIDEFESMLHIN